MTSRSELRPTVFVEEQHTYDVLVGNQVELRWAEGRGQVQLAIPYDGQQLPNQAAGGTLQLGEIAIVEPEATDAGAGCPVVVQAGGRLPDLLRSGAATVWRASYAVAPPRDVLIGVEGKVFDGAGSDQEGLADILFERPDAFVNDLFLRLTLWAPNLSARVRPERGQELEDLLLQQENQRQVLIERVGDPAALAQSMAALANAEGGRILIGVGPRAQVTGILPGRGAGDRLVEVEAGLLKAALRCEPPVPFSRPDELDHPDGTVARVLVPKSSGATYRVDGVVYRREGSVNVIAPSAPTSPIAAPAARVGDLKGILAAGSGDDVIVLDGSAGVDTLELGPMICGLINADRRDGLIVIRNIAPQAGRSLLSRLRGDGQGVLAQVERRVRQEIQRVVPRLDPPRASLSRVDDTNVVVLHVPRTPARAALYDDQGYEWAERTLRPIAIGDVFDRYIQRAGTGQAQRARGAATRVTYAELKWPIRPPETIWSATSLLGRGDNPSAYDGQRQAMVWRDCPFVAPPEEPGASQGDAGLYCALTTPLRHALMQIDGQSATLRSAAELEGTIYVQFDDMLVSGASVQVKPADDVALLANAPVVKTTLVRLRLVVDAGWLFRRRRRASLLSFRLADLTLDDEQIAAVRQACADLAFRMEEPYHVAEGRSAVLFGLRSKDFYDISLLVGIRCKPESITRELRYDQRRDSKRTETGMFDVRVALAGIGDEVAGEIALLHLQLQQLISRRLQFLRAE